MIKSKTEVYNHIIETIRPRKGEPIKDLPLSLVMNVLIRDFDFYDSELKELYCPEFAFVFGETLEDEFMIQFTCRDCFIGDLTKLFDRFDFINIKDEGPDVQEAFY
jgi:hypothetical protein